MERLQGSADSEGDGVTVSPDDVRFEFQWMKDWPSPWTSTKWGAYLTLSEVRLRCLNHLEQNTYNLPVQQYAFNYQRRRGSV